MFKNSLSPSVSLSSSQEELLKILSETDKHTFITGKAGSGKSTLLQEYKSRSKANVMVAAPTGIAALNVNGKTLHSLFELGVGLQLDKRVLTKASKELLSCLDILIIDEVSMVRADVVDAVDKRLRQAKHNIMPFGGVRLIMFGDLYQLPPIVSNPKVRDYLYKIYSGLYFFNAAVWTKAELQVYELDTIYRQTDDKFKSILNEIREGRVSQKSLDALNDRVSLDPDTYSNDIILSSTNSLVNEINDMKINEIKSKEHIYYSRKRSLLRNKNMPGHELRLKAGAKVMFTKNDPGGKWVNGSFGTVKRLNNRCIRVKIKSRSVKVYRVKWSEIEYSLSKNGALREKPVNAYKQYPLKLAYAVTIHKSQGQTYDSCHIDLKKGAFMHGQAYVALSRCKSLEGITLLSPIMSSDISVDPKIVNFMKNAIKV